MNIWIRVSLKIEDLCSKFYLIENKLPQIQLSA